MKEQIADICRKVNDSIRNFRVDPINSLEYLIPIVIFLIGIINGVVTQYTFAHNGGYGAQMDAIKTYGVFDGYSEKFTTGTTGLIVHGFFGRVIFILVGMQLILIFYKCVKNNQKGLVISLVISVILLLFQVFMTDCLFGSRFSTFYINQTIFETCSEKILTLLYRVVSVVPTIAIFIVYAVISIIAVLYAWANIFLICRIENNGSVVKNTALVFAFSMILVPLVLLFLQNVVPLLSSVLAVILMVVIIVGCFMAFAGGITEGGKTSASTKSIHGGKDNSSKRERTSDDSAGRKEKRMDKKEEKRENCAYITDLNCIGGIKLYKTHGVMNDYIMLDNGVVTRNICRLSEFEKGEFHIYDRRTGREVTSAEIEWEKRKK